MFANLTTLRQSALSLVAAVLVAAIAVSAAVPIVPIA